MTLYYSHRPRSRYMCNSGMPLCIDTEFCTTLSQNSVQVGRKVNISHRFARQIRYNFTKFSRSVNNFPAAYTCSRRHANFGSRWRAHITKRNAIFARASDRNDESHVLSYTRRAMHLTRRKSSLSRRRLSPGDGNLFISEQISRACLGASKATAGRPATYKSSRRRRDHI